MSSWKRPRKQAPRTSRAKYSRKESAEGLFSTEGVFATNREKFLYTGNNRGSRPFACYLGRLARPTFVISDPVIVWHVHDGSHLAEIKLNDLKARNCRYELTTTPLGSLVERAFQEVFSSPWQAGSALLFHKDSDAFHDIHVNRLEATSATPCSRPEICRPQPRRVDSTAFGKVSRPVICRQYLCR